jgi:hypothetical protein
MKLVLWLVLSLCVLGCRNPENCIEVWVAPNAAKYVSHVLDATDYYKQELSPHCEISFDVKITEEVDGKWHGPARILVSVGKLDPPYIGYYAGGNITLSENYADEYQTKTVIKHELGHALGLEHDHEGLMTSSVTTDELSDASLDALVKARCPD